ncbi:MAG TPA: alpha/beta fold hydrolase, partial [Verrucomicrobiae bacterium]|nr:alpha/beta fold hydrolase [Verrucomicrobiae bacterium]
MRLNFQSYGAGFPVIILHGLFGSLDNWQTISRRLGDHFHVFALDQRNHGRSPHSDVFNYEVMAGDLREFMQAHGLSHAHLLGHSLGGKTAMEFALRHPELVGKLIVVDMAPKAYPPWHVPIFKALLSLDLSAFHHRQEIVDALAPSIPALATRQFLLKNLTHDESGALRWKLNLPAICKNHDQLEQGLEIGRQFTGPVLFIKGGRSEYIEDEDQPSITRLFPRAEIITIPESGHW